MQNVILAAVVTFGNTKAAARGCSSKKVLLKLPQTIHRKHLCLSQSVFNKVAALKAFDLIKKRLQHKYFPVDIVKFLRTVFFFRTSLVAASGQFAG